MELEVQKTLERLGFTENEIKVYLSVIALGESTIGPIVSRAKVSNSKIYDLLEKLRSKGVVSYIIKGKTKYFRANQPIALLHYLEEKEQELSQLKQNVETSISSIHSLQQSTEDKQEAIIYEGYEGLHTGLFEAIKTIPDGGTYYFLAAGYSDDAYLKRFFKKLALELANRSIAIKGIADDSDRQVLELFYKNLGYKMRYTDKVWSADTTIVGDYVLILVWSKKVPVLYALKSKVLIKEHLKTFAKLWKRALA